MQLNASRYPTWAIIARNYLAIMASSVSSERAFSSAGITISKCRNRLKGIIVEALQCLKCLYQNDLIFREVFTALKEKLDMEKDELLDSAMDTDIGKDKEFSWDSILDDNDSDNDDNDETDLQFQISNILQLYAKKFPKGRGLS